MTDAIVTIARARSVERENARLLDDIATLQRALDRKTDECLRWQNLARPLLTNAEGEAGTRAMVDLELRGDVW